MASTDTGQDFLTIAEVAEALPISPQHLRILLQQNKGPPVIRLGRRLVIGREALQAWLLAREAAPGAAPSRRRRQAPLSSRGRRQAPLPNFITNRAAPAAGQPPVPQGAFSASAEAQAGSPSLSVREAELARTACKWGMSVPEVKRLTGTMTFFRGTRLTFYYAVLGDGLLDLPEAEARAIFSRATTKLVHAQRRAGIPQWWLRVLESGGGLHANLVFPATDKIVQQLLNSAVGQYLGEGGVGLQRIGSTVRDWDRITGYLAKERVPQGNPYYRRRLGERVAGSHRLGAGGGDRVQLSPALRKQVIEAGTVAPWQRSTSRNLTPRSRTTAGARARSEPRIDRPQPELTPVAPRDTLTSEAVLPPLRERRSHTQEQPARRRGRARLSRSRRRVPHLTNPRVIAA